MNIALIGYGKMGQEIEKVLLERGHEIVCIIDRDNYADFNADNFKNVEVAIEFSTPKTATENILKCLEYNVAVVCGTTAWLDSYEEVTDKCKQKNGTFFYASNYSIGVNIFRKINKILAKYMNQYSQYEGSMFEEHHSQKIDYPSGTAITLAEELIEQVDRKTKWSKIPTNSQDTLAIAAVRRSDVAGTHSICWESHEDSIEITHKAKGRRGFAIGAVIAAEFLRNKKGIFSMEDILSL